MFYAIDYESYYKKDEIDIRNMGPLNYARATYEIYLVSISGPGIEFCGHPSDAPWAELAGKTWVSHNKAFDHVIHEEAIRRGLIPRIVPSAWHCTANLAAYNQGERSLKPAAKKLLGMDLDKEYRGTMDGRLFSSLPPEERNQVLAAGIGDARACRALADKFLPSWPTFEQRLSALTIDCAHRGAPVDIEYAQDCVARLLDVKETARKEIPWATEGTDEGILSLNRAAAHCKSLGIPAPTSFAQDSEECQEWEEIYGERNTFVANLRDFRRANILLRRIERVLSGTCGDFYRYSLYYFGAHTGRWAGAGGFNMQNMNRNPVFDVDLRRIFRAPEGYTFVIRDLSNIENRALAWACGQKELLSLVRAGMSPYEAFARTIGLWNNTSRLKPSYDDATKELLSGDKTLYAIAKAMVLGLGYGCGHKKFPSVAQIMGGDSALEFLRVRAGEIMAKANASSYVDEFGDVIDCAVMSEERAMEEASREIVKTFRERNPEVVGLWEYFDDILHKNIGGRFSMELPSGRNIRYSGVHWREMKDETTGRNVRRLYAVTDGSRGRSFWGGTLTENYIQAFSRDIFGTGLLRYEESRDEDSPILWHAHDEAITMCPIGKEAKTHRLLDEAMTAPIDYCPDLPLASEGVTSEFYVK